MEQEDGVWNVFSTHRESSNVCGGHELNATRAVAHVVLGSTNQLG